MAKLASVEIWLDHTRPVIKRTGSYICIEYKSANGSEVKIFSEYVEQLEELAAVISDHIEKTT